MHPCHRSHFALLTGVASLMVLAACGSAGDSSDPAYHSSGPQGEAASSSGGAKAEDSGSGGTTIGGNNEDTESCDELDNDGDGKVDEGCSCTPGNTQPCYTGPASTRNVGECKDGSQKCLASAEFGRWGECSGAIGPKTGVFDGKDHDCDGTPDSACTQGKAPVAEVCDNQVDDDCDGEVDCKDSDCAGSAMCQESNCADGVDNDADGKVDCQDPDCPPCKETDCTNGADDDADGFADCQDSDCSTAPECGQLCGSNGECCNGKDDNGDGRVDEGDVCKNVDEPCPPGAVKACDCYCGVHRRCRADGTWGPCTVDGNGSCAPANVTSQSQCGNMSYCDYGSCTFGFKNGQCLSHNDCPMPLICDLGDCVPDGYSPCP